MNKIYHVVIFLIAWGNVWAQQPIDDANLTPFELQVLRLAGSKANDASWITPDNLPRVIEFSKWVLAQSRIPDLKYKSLDFALQVTLVTLDDPETLRQVMNDYHNGVSLAESVLLSAHESALAYLAEDLVTGSTEFREGPDRRSIRDSSAIMMLHIIWQNESFPSLTRKWARTLLQDEGALDDGFMRLPNLTRNVQQWWDHNKAAVAAKLYAKADWIPPDLPLKRYENAVLKSKANRRAEQMAMAAEEKKREEAAALAKEHREEPSIRIEGLRSALLISGEDLKDIKKVRQQERTVRLLFLLRRPEAVALLAEALFDPEQRFFVRTKDSSGRVFTSCHVFMEALDGCLEGAPAPLNIIYSDEDLPRFESWWHANKSNLRFKPSPPRQ